MIFLILAGLSPATSSSADWLARSGLDTSQPAPRLSVYAWPDGAWFSGVFTDHAVLQRSPQSATVYGVIVDSSGTLAVPTLKVSVTLHSSNSIGGTNVAAQHVDVVNKSYARWKAVLPPTAGGTEEYSVSVTCSGCGKAVTPSNFAASTGGSPTPQHTLNDILFGDVYICSIRVNAKAAEPLCYGTLKCCDESNVPWQICCCLISRQKNLEAVPPIDRRRPPAIFFLSVYVFSCLFFIVRRPFRAIRRAKGHSVIL